LVTAFVLVQPMQAKSQEVIFEGIPDFNQCFLKTHPDLPRNTNPNPDFGNRSVNITDPISMNTVVAKTSGNGNGATKVAKTVHAEKELFECRTIQGSIPVIVDVTTYVELYSNMSFNGEPPLEDLIDPVVEVITCVKVESEARFIGCEERTDQLDGVGIIVQNCKEDPIDEPQEMNTVAAASINGGNSNGRAGNVLTVEAQKEIFLCDLDGATAPDSSECNNGLGLPNFGAGTDTVCRDDDKKVDVIIFTKIWENVNALAEDPPGDPVLAKDILSLTCLVKIDTALVEECEFDLPERIVG
ncbi:MAG: hypothetical protein ACRD38_08785, partial [Nitrososphaerales archaeon]